MKFARAPMPRAKSPIRCSPVKCGTTEQTFILSPLKKKTVSRHHRFPGPSCCSCRRRAWRARTASGLKVAARGRPGGGPSTAPLCPPSSGNGKPASLITQNLPAGRGITKAFPKLRSNFFYSRKVQFFFTEGRAVRPYAGPLHRGLEH